MADVQVKHYHIGDGLRLGPGRDLFDYLAECVSDFLARKQLKGQSIPLGFTFSFPMHQYSLKSGVLVKWTKSFNCSGVEGKDVVKLLSEALERKGCCGVTVRAVLNDTTGTLMMGAYMDRQTSIGLILGTGCNACYLEKANRVLEWESKSRGEEVVIDVEWGAFGDNGVLDFIQTRFDVEVDSNSLLVNSFTFEKYISGKYLGEIVRVVLVSLVKRGLLFGGYLSNAMSRSGSFSSAMVSRIEECTLKDSKGEILQLLETFGIQNCTEDDLIVVQHVCCLVSNRSALLVSICLAELINWIDKPEVTVAVDGSLYQKHPRYQFLMHKYMKLFTNKRVRFNILPCQDGSGRGAALATAIALRLDDRFGDCWR
ncbi:UNVERIFIED_CONTAM: hypothetical protein PYX00_002146 [Menopon gallinae]|uniref:Phosphotransferase n=1 Tax=Menopon gallinae TaxID=328185 RepID=A0AAW2IFT5_9NEOP